MTTPEHDHDALIGEAHQVIMNYEEWGDKLREAEENDGDTAKIYFDVGDLAEELYVSLTNLTHADYHGALLSLMAALMTQDAGNLEVAMERATKLLGPTVGGEPAEQVLRPEGYVKDTDDVLKLFGWDRNATKGGTDED